ncbi:MAG: aminodeoxychorismate synthase component I [Fimbriimonadales bacterium]|nr:aminodeoxychorismate synthase component I [Fimbriimonadales bacterium]
MEPPLTLIRYRAPVGCVRWLLGECPQGIIVARRPSEVLPALAEVGRATQQGLSAVGFVAYEAAHGFDKAFPASQAGTPLVWFALFERLTEHGERFLPALIGSAPESAPYHLEWTATLTQSDYQRALQRIRAYIEAGDVYQVNYSFRLHAPFEGDPLALFGQLYRAQPVPYAAYIDTGEHVILSMSPELFFALNGEYIVSRPMKGTAPRGLTLEDDMRQAQALRCSEKNRAENLMIVDMARNDLGRLAKTGSVCAPSLFETERYTTLWQMTSTVEARTDAPLTEIFRAMFPAASITGAPKIRATQIIHELETTPRGVYTGAVGVVLPDRRAQFNVAIRTLHYHRGSRSLEYGVGSGVVWDSDVQGEYHECLTKAQVLLRPRPEFELLETLLWRAGRGYFLLEKHLQRLRRSAEYFGFKVDMESVRELLRTAPAAPHSPFMRLRCRLLVNRSGEARLECAPLEPKPRVWRVALAPEPVDPREVFLYHKTTHRQVYEKARAAHPGYDDVILWNSHGAITESTIANVVVKMNGRLYTPPVSCGLLAGVYRAHLLERGKIEERVIAVDELTQAEAIYLINSVRGWVRVWLEGTRPRPTP